MQETAVDIDEKSGRALVRRRAVTRDHHVLEAVAVDVADGEARPGARAADDLTVVEHAAVVAVERIARLLPGREAVEGSTVREVGKQGAL